MADPVLHVLAGPNGAGKSTFYDEILGPLTGLPFVNAEHIAARRWPGEEAVRAYDAAAVAEQVRHALIARHESFVTETEFSHPSKIALVSQAVGAGYRVTLHVILVPEDGAVARVANRVAEGGHSVPEEKIRGRYERLWDHLATAITLPITPACTTTHARRLPSGSWRSTTMGSSWEPPTGRCGRQKRSAGQGRKRQVPALAGQPVLQTLLRLGPRSPVAARGRVRARPRRRGRGRGTCADRRPRAARPAPAARPR